MEEFLEDDFIQNIIEYNLFIAINMIIDIATHIVVDNNMGNPETLSEAFNILNKDKSINYEETKVYRNMVGLRNVSIDNICIGPEM